MRPGGIIAAKIFSLGTYGFFKRVAENFRARRAGLPKPHTPGELVMEALELGAGASLPAIKNRKVREGIEHGLEIINELTPGERPSNKHKGVR